MTKTRTAYVTLGLLLAVAVAAGDVKKRPPSSVVTAPPRYFATPVPKPDVKVDATGKNATPTFFLWNLGKKDTGPFKVSFVCTGVKGINAGPFSLASITVQNITPATVDTRKIPVAALPPGLDYAVINITAAPASGETNLGNNKATLKWPCAKTGDPNCP